MIVLRPGAYLRLPNGRKMKVGEEIPSDTFNEKQIEILKKAKVLEEKKPVSKTSKKTEVKES